jgi:hypothetical protein
MQTRIFDPDLHSIYGWIPELEKSGYPLPKIKYGSAGKRLPEVYAKR